VPSKTRYYKKERGKTGKKTLAATVWL